MTDSQKSEVIENPETASSEPAQDPIVKETSRDNEPAVQAAPQQTQATPQRVEVVKSGGKGLSVFALLISLIALAGAGYTWYETNFKRVQHDSKLAVGVAEIGGQVTRLGDSISRIQTRQTQVVTQEQLTTKILEANSAVDLKIRDLTDGQVGLVESVQKINKEMQTGVNGFVVDEVSQLLKLANNSALFSGDSESAINALRLADVQLKEMADPRFSIVRRKINEEIGILSAIEPVDVESLTAQLQTLAGRVPSLKLENEQPPLEEVTLSVEAVDNRGSRWQRFTGGVSEFFVDLFNYADIQRIEQAPKPLLTPDQRYFLDQNLQLQLAKAELGALQKRPQVYSQSLQSASNWLNEYFDVNDAGVKDVIAQLNELKAKQIIVELPAISASYDLLQSIKGGQ